MAGLTREQRAERNAKMPKIDRVPVGAENKLEFMGLDPDYFYYVVNTSRAGRLDKFLRAGYEFCYDEQRQHKEGVAETTADDSRIQLDLGSGDKGYLMRLHKQYRDEDLAAKRGKIDDIEKSMAPKKNLNQYGAGLTDDY